MELLSLVLGVVCLALILWDVFETIVVPRPTPSSLRLGRHLVPWTWRAWRAIGERTRNGLGRDLFYGLYAPAAAIMLLAAWIFLLIFGYALILFGIRDQLQPVPSDFGTVLYFAAASVLTVGYGDVVPVGAGARLLALAGAATGLGLVALVITFLFSLFGSYQRRERLVVSLSARAKSPPSAVTLLENYVRLDLVRELPTLFSDWERWSAEVLDSHVAYPLLNYFRSSHDNLSWISALGAMLDAAALVLTTVRDVPRGQAELMKRVGAHFVEDISNYFGYRAENGSIVDESQFDEAYRRLEAAGYSLEPAETAWPAFERARTNYASRLEFLASYWATSAPVWIAERVSLASAVHQLAAAPHEHPVTPPIPSASAPATGVREPDSALPAATRRATLYETSEGTGGGQRGR
jgi:hypothetical protein